MTATKEKPMPDPTPADILTPEANDETRTTIVGDTRITYPVATTVTYELVRDDDA